MAKNWSTWFKDAPFSKLVQLGKTSESLGPNYILYFLMRIFTNLCAYTTIDSLSINLTLV